MDKNQGDSASIEELYLKEKKKASILMGSTALLAVLLVGSLVMNNGDSSNGSATDSSAVAGQQQNFQQRGQGGPGGGQGGPGIANFLNDDGSVNADAISQISERAAQFGGDSSQFTGRFAGQIDTALSTGEITESQADALKQAFGL